MDDEYLIKLQKEQAQKTKENKEKEQKIQRTKAMTEALRRLSEDGKLTKEVLKDQIESVKQRRQRGSVFSCNSSGN